MSHLVALRSRVRSRTRSVCWCLALVAAALIPVTTSGGEIAFTGLAILWFIAGTREIGYVSLFRNRVGVLALGLFGWLTLSALWSGEDWMTSLRILVKYRTLLFVPILMSLFEDQRLRRLSTSVFLGAMTVTLGLSYLMWFGYLAPTKWGNAANCAVFKNHITQNVMMAFTAFVLARSAVAHQRWRWFKVGLATLASINVLCMVSGRTGYVIFVALAVYFACTHLGRRGLVRGPLLVALAAVVVYFAVPQLRDRVDMALFEATHYFSGEPIDTSNSIGLRLQFYETSLQVAAQRPLFGHGVGAFRRVYGARAAERGIPTDNPHNEYLMVLVQSGAVGLLLLIGLFAVQWTEAARLAPGHRTTARALVVTIAVGCVFNSLLLDSTEGSFFALFTVIAFAGLSRRVEAAEPPVAPGTA